MERILLEAQRLEVIFENSFKSESLGELFSFKSFFREIAELFIHAAKQTAFYNICKTNT